MSEFHDSRFTALRYTYIWGRFWSNTMMFSHRDVTDLIGGQISVDNVIYHRYKES